MSRHRLVDAPRSDALLIALLVGGVAALGAGAYWAIKATIDSQKSEASTRTAAPSPRVEPRPSEPEPTPVPEPAVAAEPVPPDEADEADEVETEPDVDRACELDEVACLLAEEPPACCAIYGKRGEPLGKDDITSVIDNDARRKIMRCQTDPPFEGTVKASVKVSPNGNVASVSVGGDDGGDAPNKLARCVASALKKLKFRKTSEGGSFRYPFAFR